MIAKIGDKDGKPSETLSDHPKTSKKDAPDLAEKKQHFDAHIQKKTKSKKNKKNCEPENNKESSHSTPKKSNEKSTVDAPATLIDIPNVIQFTGYISEKTPQTTQNISKIVHETPVKQTSAATLKQNYIDNQVQQLEKPGSVCTTGNHTVHHQVDGTLHWRIINGPLQGLEITAQILGATLHIGIKAFDQKQRDIFLKNHEKIEILAKQKRGGKPVKLEIIDGKH